MRSVERDSGLRYVGIVGAGGWSEVYEAWDPRTGASVAVKEYLRPVTDDATRAAFERECRAAERAGLHPQIATSIASGIADGIPWQAMPLFEGGSLARRLRAGPLAAQESLRITAIVADTLAWAHSRQPPVLHRDIKPANILLDAGGRPVLSDVALASLLEGPAFSPDYAAPEVLTGGSHSGASEVWSLTVTLHEMLTGSAPFTFRPGETIASFLARLRTPGSAPALPAGSPERLRHLLFIGLALDPAQRPSGMREFARMVRELERACGFAVTPDTLGPPRVAPAGRPAAIDNSPPLELIGSLTPAPFLAPAPPRPRTPRSTRGAGVLVAASAAVVLTAGLTAGGRFGWFGPDQQVDPLAAAAPGPEVSATEIAATRPKIASTPLPPARVGRVYSASFIASGDGPLRWAVVSGDLPPGLRLRPDGRVTGRAGAVDVCTVVVRVTDAAGNSAVAKRKVTAVS